MDGLVGHQVAALHGRYGDDQNLSENGFMLEVVVTNSCPKPATPEFGLDPPALTTFLTTFRGFAAES